MIFADLRPESNKTGTMIPFETSQDYDSSTMAICLDVPSI